MDLRCGDWLTEHGADALAAAMYLQNLELSEHDERSDRLRDELAARSRGMPRATLAERDLAASAAVSEHLLDVAEPPLSEAGPDIGLDLE